MTKPGRTPPTPPPAPKPERPPLRHAGVWLATLSAVVGVATGMFSLRDELFPRESSTAEAVSAPAYQQQVGEICDEMNEIDRARARDDRKIEKALERARTTVQQRNVLLDGLRRSTARSGHALASFSGLAAPEDLAPVRRDAEVAWNRNLARLRDYASELDRARTRKRVVAAVDDLAVARPEIGRDGDRLRAGLERLGADSCDLEPPLVTTSYTLPPPRGSKARDKLISSLINLPSMSTGSADTPADDPQPGSLGSELPEPPGG